MPWNFNSIFLELNLVFIYLFYLVLGGTLCSTIHSYYVQTLEMYDSFLYIHTGGRDLLDIRSQLQHNSENQRLIAREADHLQLEMMAQQTQTKMKVHNNYVL